MLLFVSRKPPRSDSTSRLCADLKGRFGFSVCCWCHQPCFWLVPRPTSHNACWEVLVMPLDPANIVSMSCLAQMALGHPLHSPPVSVCLFVCVFALTPPVPPSAPLIPSLGLRTLSFFRHCPSPSGLLLQTEWPWSSEFWKCFFFSGLLIIYHFQFV